MPTDLYKYERFFELSLDVFCIVGYDGYLKKINNALPTLLGYTIDELYSKPVDYFIYKDDLEITRRLRKELINSKPIYNFENRYVTKSGSLIWLSWTSLTVESEQVIFAIAKDITLRKQLEYQRIELLTELSQANENLKNLGLTAAHDLRSPLVSLLAIIDLMDQKDIQNPEVKEFVNVLKNSGTFFKNSVDQYIDSIKDHKQWTVTKEEIDLESILDNVKSSIEGLIKISRTTIFSDFKQFKTVSFNMAYMESIFLNLISNSIKYAQPDKYPIISIRTQISNGKFELIFSDNGEGFEIEEKKNQLFELSNQHLGKDSKGVGLYLVASHIKSMGGQINVESQLGEGTTFTIIF